MDLSLTETQELIKSTARQFVGDAYPKDVLLELDRTDTGFSDDLWRQVADLGWLGMAVPEEYGGSGNSLTDVAVLFEELGRGPVPGPYFSSAVAGALAIMEMGTEEQKRTILPDVAEGRRILALAVTEPDYGWEPGNVTVEAQPKDGGYVVTGTKLFVHDAIAATDFICPVLTDDGLISVLVGAGSTGISVRPLSGFIAGVGEVTMDSVEVSASAVLGGGTGARWSDLERAMLRAAPVLSAYKVGACQAVFEMSVDYSRERRQFGRPIGRFQRVQDHIVNLVNGLDAARWTTYEALWKLDTDRPAASSVHMAKAVSSEAYLKACDYAHEVHAGIGVVREYGLTLHTKMSRTLYHFLGGPKFHKRKLATALGL